MRKTRLVIFVGLTIFLAAIPAFWFYGNYYIKKMLQENPAVKIETANITGFPLSYNLVLENIAITGKLKDTYLIKKVEAQFGLLDKVLNIRTLGGIVATSSATGEETIRYYKCDVPTTTNFEYRDYFWFVLTEPELKNFSYLDTGCTVTDNNNQELLRIDSNIINLENAKNTTLKISTKGFKNNVFEEINIGDFEIKIEGEFEKEISSVNNSNKNEKGQNQKLFLVSGKKVNSMKLNSSLISALKIDSNFEARLQNEGYNINGEFFIPRIENIINVIAKRLNLNESIIFKLIEIASTKEDDTTRIGFKFTPKDGIFIGNQQLKDLVKKYFYLQQSKQAAGESKPNN